MKRVVLTVLAAFSFSWILAHTSTAACINAAPQDACKFMTEIDLATRGYKNSDGLEYLCSSPYKEFGNGGSLRNNIAYYAEGQTAKINRLKLVVNVNQKNQAKSAHSELHRAAELLVKKTFGSSLPDGVDKSLITGSQGSWKHKGCTIKLNRKDWPTGKGYELRFTIEE